MRTFLFLVTAGILSAIGGIQAAEPAAVESPSVVEVPGCWIKFIDTAVLASERAGVLSKVIPIEGDAVLAGQDLVILRDEVAAAQYAIADREASNDIEIRYAKAAADVAKAEYNINLDTNSQSRSGNVIPKVEVERSRLAWIRAVLQYEKAQNDFELAKLRKAEKAAELKTYRIVAPFDGIVTRVLKTDGQAVQMGDPVLELVNNRRLRVEGYIDPGYARLVKRGTPVEVSLEGQLSQTPAEVYPGKVVFVDVSVEPVTHKVRVWAEVENRNDGLRVGLNARMRILTNWKPEAKTAAVESAVR